MATSAREALVVAGLSFCWVLLAAPGPAQPRLADRVVQSIGREDMGLFVYAGISQSYFRFVVTLLARSARVPIGFEEVAQEPEAYDGNLARIPAENRTHLIGLTAGRALDLLVATDARYSWREQNGVLLLRPVTAWRDTNHFLHQPGRAIDARRRPAIEIVRELYDARGLRVMSAGGGLIGDPPHHGDLHRPLLVRLPPTSLLDALNAIIGAHGQLGWMVAYARGPADLRNSCIRVITFEGKFAELGAGAACAAGY